VTERFDPSRILEALNRHHVRYVLIGGLAATLQGSPLVTTDVDVTPERARDNLDRLSAALRELDARIRTHAVQEGLPFDHSGESLGAADIWNLKTRAGDLDITFVPAGTAGYADLKKDVREIDVMGVSVPVASLADIVRSKQAAGRDKDLLSLPTLRRLLEAEEDARRGAGGEGTDRARMEDASRGSPASTRSSPT
jgi:hypothetical protein